MSFIRPQSSLKLCKAFAQPNRTSRSQQLRYLSQTPSRFLGEPSSQAVSDADAKQATKDQANLAISERSPASGSDEVDVYRPEHQPDYNAPVDHGTSCYSPIPKRVMDGSEPGETLAAAVLSGAPVDLQARQVRIHKPVRPANQSGTWGSHAWRMDWDVLGKGHRWENPLMGWQSSADFMQGTKLQFKTKEDAIAFAQKQGYEYFVQEPNERRLVPKAYANNFLHESKPLKHIKTK